MTASKQMYWCAAKTLILPLNVQLQIGHFLPLTTLPVHQLTRLRYYWTQMFGRLDHTTCQKMASASHCHGFLVKFSATLSAWILLDTCHIIHTFNTLTMAGSCVAGNEVAFGGSQTWRSLMSLPRKMMYSNTSSRGGTGWSVGRSSVPNDLTVQQIFTTSLHLSVWHNTLMLGFVTSGYHQILEFIRE